jgi:hypothetical protein
MEMTPVQREGQIGDLALIDACSDVYKLTALHSDAPAAC